MIAGFHIGGVAPSSGGSPSSFPGQIGNPVGFAASPGYPGSLTSWGGGALTNGTLGSPTVYSFIDFGNTFQGSNQAWQYITFIGCRFSANQPNNRNVQLQPNAGSGQPPTGSWSGGLLFSYCSFTPLPSDYTSPPGYLWPSAGAQDPTNPLGDTGMVEGVNCIDGTKGYQYGLIIDAPAASVTVDHCDFWGFGNFGPAIYGTYGNVLADAPQVIVSDCHIHDPAYYGEQSYHIDGTGYVNGSGAPYKYAVRHCTIAGIGNTNAIAFQSASRAYDTIEVSDSYLSGFSYVVDMCHNVVGNQNLTFTGNTFATDLGWRFGPCYADFTACFSGNNNVWSGNKLKIVSGNGFSPGGNDGDFVWPDGTFHATDF